MNETLNLEESLKKKLETGEISQQEYDDLITKFGNLDLLSTRVDTSKTHHRSHRKWSFAGSDVVDGDDVEVPVKVSGKLLVKGDLKCPEMKVSGKTTIDGNLTVVDGLKTSGHLLINEDGKLGGSVKISGKLEVRNNLYITDNAKISGKLIVGSMITSGESLIVSGKINSDSIQSTGLIKLSGIVQTNGDLVTSDFISSGGGSVIGGNLEARMVEIAKRFRENSFNEDEDIGEINDLSDIGRFVSDLVGKIVPKIVNMSGGSGFNQPPRIFEINGNLEADLVDISYTHIKGDLIADDVLIGPDVVVDGVIKYKNSIMIPEGTEYQTEKSQ